MSDLTPMRDEDLDRMVAIARDHDSEAIAIFVLHGSPERGLAVSGWTGFEGPDAESQALNLLFASSLQEDKLQ